MATTNPKGKKLVIVESPTKQKTISKILGNDYIVRSSFGHVRDLPSKDIGVDIEHGFKPTYVAVDRAKRLIAELTAAAKNASIAQSVARRLFIVKSFFICLIWRS